jgi:UDP-N-acetylglucosamine/UDP-N-acetyl-alpha-D-glucosaminouronate 4-epimerase
VVAGNLLAASADPSRVAGQVFNLATGMRVTLNETVQILRDLTGYHGEIQHGPERSGDVKHSLADITNAKSQFGYEPIVLFPKGLKKTVDWYRPEFRGTPIILAD